MLALIKMLNWLLKEFAFTDLITVAEFVLNEMFLRIIGTQSNAAFEFILFFVH
jgi:hypothetical protein